MPTPAPAAEVDWDGAPLPARADVVIHAPVLHRDDRLPFAHRFAPELWLDGDGTSTARDAAVLTPFSAGTGQCPAARLVRDRAPRLADPGRVPAGQPLPRTLDHATLAFETGAAGS